MSVYEYRMQIFLSLNFFFSRSYELLLQQLQWKLTLKTLQLFKRKGLLFLPYFIGFLSHTFQRRAPLLGVTASSHTHMVVGLES